MGKNTSSSRTDPHPQRGRRYTSEELQRLTEEGDAWSMRRLDEWERCADVYSVEMTDACPDQNCQAYGEPVTICHGAGGAIVDIDHGGWGHYLSSVHAKAS